MKYLKMLALALVATTAVVAFTGASSASATVLCRTAVSPCPEGERWGTGTSLDASLQETSTWENPLAPVSTCIGSTLAAKTTSAGSATETVTLLIEALNFTTCTQTTDVVTPGELQIHWIAGTTDGTITDRGTAGKFITCSWIFGPEWVDIGRIHGGNPATIEMSAPLTGCLLSRVTGSYTVTSPKPLYVVSS